MSYWNVDGGWGYESGNTSDSLDTALALQALKAANYPDLSVINTALAYLMNSQNSDGGWGFYKDNPSNVYMTAVVSATLQQFPQTATIANAITKASAYLVPMQNGGGGFGYPSSSVYETALVYSALIGTTTDAVVLGNALNYLISSQSSNGSWNDDPYSTALALKALYLSEHIPAPPLAAATTGSVMGTIIDATTKAPIANVSVQLAGDPSHAAASDGNGMFALYGIPSGSQQITLSYPGYASVAITASISAGTFINIGKVALSVNSTTGTVMGTVWNADKNEPFGGVTVQVTSGFFQTLQALSAPDGSYKITGVDPGVITVGTPFGNTVEKYWNVQATGTLAPGGIFIYNPMMSQTHPPFVTVFVGTDKAIYGKGDAVGLMFNIQNNRSGGYGVLLKVRVSDPAGAIVYENTAELALTARQLTAHNMSFTLPTSPQGGFYTVLSEVYDRAGEKIGEKIGDASAEFGVFKSSIAVTPTLPAAFSSGTNTVSFSLANTGNYAVTSGSLNITLTDPDGQVIETTSQPFSLGAGANSTLTFALSIPPVKFGVYNLSYTQSDETTSGQAIAISLPNTVAITPIYDKTTYRVRETAYAQIRFANTGRFSVDALSGSEVTVKIDAPDAGYSDTKQVTLDGSPGTAELAQTIALPSTMTAGQHDAVITLILSSGSTTSLVSKITIPDASISMTLSRVSFTAGATISPAILNNGGVDASVQYTVSLYDPRSALVSTQTGSMFVQAGASQPLNIGLPSGAADGTYALVANYQNGANGSVGSSTFSLAVSGVKATLAVQTDKPIYLATDAIAGLSTITNIGTDLQNGSLHLQVAATGDSELRRTWKTQYDFQQGTRSGVDTFTQPGSLMLTSYSDDFEAGYINADRWNAYASAAGGADPSIVSGRLFLVMPNGGWAQSYADTAIPLSGNFDVAMDYQVDASNGYSNGNNHPAGLAVWNPSGMYMWIDLWGSMNYGSCGANNYCNNSWGGARYVGKLRITRTGSVASFYFWNWTTNAWAPILNSNITTAPVYIRVYASGQNGNVKTYFDNFTVASQVYPASGTINLTYDSGRSEEWGALNFTANTPVGTAVRFRTRTAEDQGGLSTAAWSGYITASGSAIASPKGRWIEVESMLSTSDTNTTPVIHEIAVTQGRKGGNALWQTDIPVSMLQGAVSNPTATIGGLNVLGKLYLQGALTSSTGQNIAASGYPFYIIQGNTALLLATDRKTYKPGEAVTISGEVKNLAAIEALALGIQIEVGGRSLYTTTADVPANGSYPFTVTTTAGASGAYLVTGKVLQNSAVLATTADQYETADPVVTATLTAPDSAGFAPFDITMKLDNPGKVDAAIRMQMASDKAQLMDTQDVQIPAGETRLLHYTRQITASTTYVYTISGDLNQTLSKNVLFGPTGSAGAKSVTVVAGIDKTVYGANDDVNITATLSNNDISVHTVAMDMAIEDPFSNRLITAGTVTSFTIEPTVMSGWSYRIPSSVTIPRDTKNKVAGANVDFSAALATLGVPGSSVDRNSIRVVEIDAAGNLIGEKQAQALFRTDTTAWIRWYLDGSMTANSTRYFHIYFDTIDHGAKVASVKTHLPKGGDLVGYIQDAGQIYVMENGRDGTFGPANQTAVISNAYGARGIALDDFNGDGYADIVAGARCTVAGCPTNIYYYQNKADGSNAFDPGTLIGSISTSSGISNITAADFNNDGNKDIVVGDTQYQLHVFLNNNGIFTRGGLPIPPGTIRMYAVASADFDNDGNMDLLVLLGGDSGGVYHYRGRGDGTFASPVRVLAMPTLYYMAPSFGLTAGDFDEDGKIDFVSGDSGTGAYFCKGNGDGTFAARGVLPITPGTAAFSAADLNGDGHLDLIADGFNARTITYYPGNGKGTFRDGIRAATLSGDSLAVSVSPVLAEVVPAVGAAQTVPARTIHAVWNTGSTRPDNYRVHVSVTESGATLDDSYAGFTITPDNRAVAKVTTDKIAYNANELATITSTITNLSTNAVLENLTALVTIRDTSAGMQVYAETKTVATLLPGATINFKSYWNTGTKTAGTYPVTVEIRNAVGTIVATATQAVVIKSTVDPRTALKGQITVDKQSLLSGEPVTASWTLTNMGNADIQSVSLSLLTMNTSEQVVYDSLVSQVSLTMGMSQANTWQINTSFYTAKDYLVILRASINGGPEETLSGSYFRVEGAPSVPALSAPANGSDVQTVIPVLTVNNASDPNDDKLTYEFELYADSRLAALITSAGGIVQGTNTTVFPLPAELTENSTYYWRSRAFDGKLYGDWMSPASFRVNVANDPPTAPTISSPMDNTEVSVLTPTFTVNNASDPDSTSLTYNFEVAQDPDFVSMVTSTTGVMLKAGAISWMLPVTLQENTWYYWRAQADDWLDAGPWSATAKLFVNTTNEPPSIPVILSPVGSNTVAGRDVSIVLQNSTDPDSPVISYFFEVDTVPTFDSASIIRSGVIPAGPGTTTWQAIGLQDNTPYYVRAMVGDGSANSSWTQAIGFFVNTANDAPTPPVIANPSIGAGVNVFTPALTVHNATDLDRDVLTYEFEVASDAAFADRVAGTAGITEAAGTTSWPVPVAMTENQTYYWRARAFDGSLNSGWTTGWFVVNTANDAPGAPTIMAPLDGGSVDTVMPMLKVQNALDPDSDHLTYDFEVYNGTTLVWSIMGVTEGAGGNTSVTIPTALSDNTVYQWQSRAYDGDRYGPWTAKATFTVHLPQTGITVEIRIEPETLNAKSNGNWVMAEIELPHGFKASDVDISSIRLEGTVLAELRPYELNKHHFANGCGADTGEHDHGVLKVKFSRSAVIAVLPVGDHVPVHVTGTIGALTFEGVDIIRVIH